MVRLFKNTIKYFAHLLLYKMFNIQILNLWMHIVLLINFMQTLPLSLNTIWLKFWGSRALKSHTNFWLHIKLEIISVSPNHFLNRITHHQSLSWLLELLNYPICQVKPPVLKAAYGEHNQDLCSNLFFLITQCSNLHHITWHSISIQNIRCIHLNIQQVCVCP